MGVDAAHGRHINHFLAQNLPVRHDDDQIRIQSPEVAQRIRIKNMLLPQHPLHNLQNLPMHLQRSVILPVLTAQRRQRIQAVDEIQMLLAHQPSADFHRLFAVFHRQIQ